MSSRREQHSARRVGVIGAGVSGLATAKVFAHEGHQVTVFEQKRSLGGVWAPERTYPGLTTQTPGDQYAFSDFPMPAHYSDWPSAAQVMEYLQAYAERFGILPLIRCQSPVVTVRRPPGATSGWWVTSVEPTGCRVEHEFDFVVICNGTFNTPNYPQIKGMEIFRAEGGIILHSAEFTSTELIRNRKVVVIGYGKSATDIACVAAGSANVVNLVFRRSIWPVPKFLGGLVHVRHVCTSRLWEALMPVPVVGAEDSVWRTLRDGLPSVCWWAMEEILSRQFGLDRFGLRPAHRFKDQVTSGFLVSPDELFTLIRDGRIHAFQGDIDRFTPHGVTLSNGIGLGADIVILGTGYRQETPFLDAGVRARIVDGQGRYRLYRYLLNPDLPDLGFVGYNSSLFTPITSELGARWLAAHVAGRMTLPTPEHMHRTVATELQIGKSVRPLARRFTGVNVAPYTYHYLDTLRQDIAETSPPRGLRSIHHFVKPFAPADFA